MTEATISNTTATFEGRELTINTWSNQGAFIEASSGRHYCPGEGCGRCARGEDHNFGTGYPCKGSPTIKAGFGLRPGASGQTSR